MDKPDPTGTANDPSGTLTAHSAEQTAGTAEWAGNERYDVVRRIGEGGMGVVYEAFDRERGQAVALKSLLNFSPAALYRFKQEFRTLADVHHPNLVRLYELVVTESDNVFFTMELVSGTDFLTYVQRPGTHRDQPPDPHTTIAPRASAEATRRLGPSESSPPPESSSKTSPADFDVLRRTLRQLVRGVMALHGAGKLHRDIKPSNVLVADDGRVVILDFGVATELSRVVDENLAEEQDMVGTARYMAPEQAAREAPTQASDWYSIGVVLYEALVGKVPFAGSTIEVITMKTLHDPVPPAECVEGIPPDLDELCRALLDRDAEKRPAGLEILRRLGTTQSPRPAPSPIPVADSPRTTALVGRERQLASLRDGFEQVLSGRSVTMHVAGESGMGKSAVVQHFLDGLVQEGEAVVLRGRAYERESVPYKAVDSVIDELSRYLVHLEEQGNAIELPADIDALARVFPVLRRVASINAVAEAEVRDPNLVRRRAFVALRELLAALANRQPLVIYVDDVQWGDADSAALVLELVRPPRAPAVLFVMTHRDQEAQASSFLAEIRARWPEGAESHDISVGPLDPADAQRLAMALLESSGELAQRTARAIARESRGSPFLIEELVRGNLSVEGAPQGATLGGLSLGQMVAQRLDRLPDVARLVLEVLAVGGRPLPVSVIAQASGTGDRIEEAIAAARARSFLRTGLRDGREVVETTHNRFRETIVAQLSVSKVREHHGSLARVLEATPGADPEAVALHWFGAGDTGRAAEFAERAARQAAKQLAFGQAARLYRLTIDTLHESSPELGRLYGSLGEVLGWQGHSEGAARAYLAAADRATALDRLKLEGAGAGQLIAAGRFEEGGIVLRRVLATAGVKVPASPISAILWLILFTLRLRIFGLRFKERPVDEVLPADRIRIDAMNVAALGLATADTIMAGYMAARQMVEALRVGHRGQVLRAAVIYGQLFARAGGRVSKPERDVRKTLARLTESGASVEEVAYARGTAGVALFLRGRWREALETIDQAYAELPSQVAGMQAQAALFAAYALVYLGDLVELRRRQARLLADADQRGGLAIGVQLRASHPTILCLAADDPDAARRQTREAKAQSASSKFLTLQWQIMRSEAEIEIYAGNGALAYERLMQDERALKKSLMLGVQFVRALTNFVRGRAAIASIDEGNRSQRRARLAEARRLARQLERERMPWIAPLAAILKGAVANIEGHPSAARASLEQAAHGAQTANMALFAAAARYQLGLAVGGHEGAKLVEEADAAMRSQDVRAPARFATMLVPGRWEAVGTA
jgi:serine/threonine protein kinase